MTELYELAELKQIRIHFPKAFGIKRFYKIFQLFSLMEINPVRILVFRKHLGLSVFKRKLFEHFLIFSRISGYNQLCLETALALNIDAQEGALLSNADLFSADPVRALFCLESAATTQSPDPAESAQVIDLTDGMDDAERDQLAWQ